MSYQDRVTKVPFHTIANITLNTNVFTLDLNPTILSSRLSAIADAYNNYRCTKLEYRVHPPSFTTTKRILTAGYVAGGSTTAPAAIGSIEYAYMAIIKDAQTVPTNWVEVGREALKGPLPWYRAVPQASVDTTEESFASIYFWSDDALANCVVEIRGVFEFKDPLDPALTLERRKVREQKMARLEQLLSAIRIGPASGASKTSSILAGLKLPTQN